MGSISTPSPRSSESYTVNNLTITPLKPDSTFGAEVSGLDFNTIPFPDDVIKTLTTLLHHHALLIFRHTNLNNEKQVTFCHQLGKIEENPSWGGSLRVENKFLFDVSNLDDEGRVVGRGNRKWHHALGNALWHTDSSFNQHRAKYSLLLAHVVPGSGQGNTDFCDTRMAFQDLSAEKKEELRGLVAEHELWHSRRLASPGAYAALTAEEMGTKPPAYHKLVQMAPNGEETFYLATHAKRLFKNGKEMVDSQKLVWDLIEHCAQPKYVITAEWKEAGTLMWWDNRQSMHRASAYSENMGPRDMRRATVKDDGPLACGISKEEILKLEL